MILGWLVAAAAAMGHFEEDLDIDSRCIRAVFAVFVSIDR